MGRSLDGKVAIVTGAGRGIGKACALILAEDGASVALSGRDQARLEAMVVTVEALGVGALAVSGDVSRVQDVERLVAETRERFGRIDVLVNNAGIIRDALLIRMKDEDWDEVLAVNLKGAFYTSRACARVMMRQRSGRIINIASVAGLMGNAGQVNYSAAKAGLLGLTKAAARELAHWGILVNAVAPGLIDTDILTSLPAEARDALLSQIPLKRVGTSREVAEVVRFLASDGAGYMTGQVIQVNGGLYM